MRVALDTNCFIDAVNPNSTGFASLQTIIAAFHAGEIAVFVSRHTLAELCLQPDAAYKLAKEVEILPYWPIGAIKDQVATIEQLTGTWEDARRNEEIQQELRRLAASGNDIRDRGAFLDALLADLGAFVTSDKHLAGDEASKRIHRRFGMRVLKPTEFVADLAGQNEGQRHVTEFGHRTGRSVVHGFVRRPG